MTAALLAGLALAGSPMAQAEDGRCAHLASQLAALQGTSSQTRVTQYLEAIDRQNAEYERTLDYVRSIGCDLDPQAGPQCRSLEANLQRMRRNLDGLQVQYQRLSDTAGQSREDERQRLRAMIEDLRCNGPAAPRARSSVGLYESLFGPDEAGPGLALPPPQEGELQDFNVPEGDGLLAGRTVRTICVRKCDGFYFPISFATDSSRFAEDARACAEQCPSAEAELYAYDTYAQQPDDAVSTSTGAALKDMANAFRFRTSFDAACTCKRAAGRTAESIAPADEALKRLDEATLDAAGPKKPPKPGKPAKMSPAPAPAAAPVPAGTVIETTTAAGEKKRVRVIGPPALPAP